MTLRFTGPRRRVSSFAALAAAAGLSLAPAAIGGAAHAASTSPSTATPGTLVASDPNGNRIQALAPDGTSYTVASGFSNTPYGVAVDAAGNVYVGDENYGVIEIAPDGTRTTLPFTGVSFAFRVAVDPAGDVFVVDLDNQRVVELPADGSGQRTVPTPGINYPFGLAVDQAGNAYVSDEEGPTVLKVAPDDTVTPVGTGFSYARGVAVDNTGNVYVADTGNNRVVEVAPDNTQKDFATGVQNPETITVDQAGSVYVTSSYYYYGGNTVTQIDPDGTETPVNLQTGYTYGLAVSPNPRSAQSVAFSSKPSTAPAVGDRYDVTANAGASGKPVVFSADPSSNACSVVSHGDTTATVSLTGIGTCVIDASQGGNRGYLPGSAQQSFGVKANQAITFTNQARTHRAGDTYQMSATGGASGNPVVFSAAPTTASHCSVSATGTVTFEHAKRCTVVATQDGNGGYYVARAFKTLTVHRGLQKVTFTKTSGHHADAGTTFRFKGKGGKSGNHVRIHVAGACTVTPSGKVTFKHAGVCHVSAVQAGNADYRAGRDGYKVTVK